MTTIETLLLAEGARPATIDGRDVIQIQPTVVYDLAGGYLDVDTDRRIVGAWLPDWEGIPTKAAWMEHAYHDPATGSFTVKGADDDLAHHLEGKLLDWARQHSTPAVLSDLTEEDDGRITWEITHPDGHTTHYSTNTDGEGIWSSPDERPLGLMRQQAGTLQWNMSGLSRAQMVAKIRRRFGAITGTPAGRLSAAHLRALRTSLGLSVRDLAELVDVKPGSARAWDKGAYLAPAGVIAELHAFKADTDDTVADLADYYRQHPAAWPMLIPRLPEDVDDFEAPVEVPESVTVDWWKLVAVRVCDRVPGLWVEWNE